MVGFTNTNERKLHVLPLNCLKNKVSVSFLFFFPLVVRYHYGRILKEYERSVGMHNNSSKSLLLFSLETLDYRVLSGFLEVFI